MHCMCCTHYMWCSTGMMMMMMMTMMSAWTLCADHYYVDTQRLTLPTVTSVRPACVCGLYVCVFQVSHSRHVRSVITGSVSIAVVSQSPVHRSKWSSVSQRSATRAKCGPVGVVSLRAWPMRSTSSSSTRVTQVHDWSV